MGAIREGRFLRKKGLIPDPLGEGKNPKRKKNYLCRQTGKIPGTDRNSSSRRPTSIRYVYTCLKGCANPPSFYGNLILCSFRLAFEIINSSSDNTIHGFSFFNDTDDIPSSRGMVSREHWAAAGVEATWILRGVIAVAPPVEAQRFLAQSMVSKWARLGGKRRTACFGMAFCPCFICLC